MSKQSDNPADAFKKALAEATKVMSNDPDLTVSYSVDPSGLSGDSMRLPQVSRRMTREEVLLARGTADALALNRRYHNGQTHAKYMPAGDMARDLYEAMETARCEAVGARDMPGTAGNIDAKIKYDSLRKGYDQAKQPSDVPLATAAGYLVRHLATGRDMPAGAANAMELWRGYIEDQAGGTLETLNDTMAISWAMTPIKATTTKTAPRKKAPKKSKSPIAPVRTIRTTTRQKPRPSSRKSSSRMNLRRRCRWMTPPIRSLAKRPRCPMATPRWSRPPRRKPRTRTRIIWCTRPIMTR